jgi:CubicO group peptidase (beta-lactamase class C family)
MRGHPRVVARVYSASKLVTPVIVLQHVEKGLFALDDPIGDYVPEWALDKVLRGFAADGTAIIEPAKTQATWRMLCNHTAA